MSSIETTPKFAKLDRTNYRTWSRKSIAVLIAMELYPFAAAADLLPPSASVTTDTIELAAQAAALTAHAAAVLRQQGLV